MAIRGLLDRRLWLIAALIAAGTGISAALLPQAPVANDRPVPPPAPETGAYLAGRYAQHVDDWKAAAEFLGTALARDPEDSALLRRTFMLKLGDGRIDEALSLARRMEGQEPPSALAQLLIAADHALHDNFAAASAVLAALPADNFAKFAGPMFQAWLRLAQGDATGAQAALEPLSAVPGLAPLHALHAGMIAEQAGDLAAARNWYEQAVKGGGATLRVVQVVGSFLDRNGSPDQARALVEDFTRQNADGLLLDPAALGEEGNLSGRPALGNLRDGMAEALFDLGSALHQEGTEEMALVYARLALVLRPDFPLARLMVGDIQFGRNRPLEALEQYRLVTGDPALGWSARLRSAEALNKAERLEEAAALLDSMAIERPNYSDPLIRLGDLYRGVKQYEKAADAYGRALERTPVLEERHWTILYGRAACWERVGAWEKAEKDLVRAMELSRDQPLLLNFLGYGWVDKGVNLTQARAMIERAVALRPKDGYIIDSLGWALYRMGDFKGAVQQLERAIELKPLDPTINDHLGDAFWAVGRHTEALFQWRRALQNAEEPEQNETLRKKIQEREKQV